MPTAMEVAKFLLYLKKIDPRKLELSNLKLQKLLYYCQGYYFALQNDNPLFEDNIEAWKYGPVIGNVYRHFKKFGDLDIDIQVSRDDFSDLDNVQLSTIALVWKYLGEYRASTLVDMTHQESPWLNAWFFNDNDKTIYQEEIRDYFQKNIPNELLQLS
jgi:uncharacterized phage-associated protein